MIQLTGQRRLTLLVAAATVAALALTGCAPEGTAAPGTESAKQQAAFPEIYEQTLDWDRCGDDEASADALEASLREAGARVDGMTCTNVRVPLDWDDPANDETIGLRAVLIPATGGEPIGTLFSNPGGPGGSGTALAIQKAVDASTAALQEQYHFFGFDPRGIGASTPLNCESQSAILALDLALCAEQDPHANSMGSVQVARDMELMRHLMGDDLLHYAGFSYGTVIGASYATIFPERVGRVMLDSAWPSDWASPLGRYQQREAASVLIIDMLELCGEFYEVATCPPQNEEALAEQMEVLSDEPLVASDGTLVDAKLVREFLKMTLYDLKPGREQQLDVLGRALDGDQTGIDEVAEKMAGGGMQVQLPGMVVRCLSSPRDPGIMKLYHYIEESGLPKDLGGPEINDDTLKEWIELGCDGLPDSGEDYLMFDNKSENPILVFGITGDSATPYAGSQQMVDELGNARLVTVEGRGHIASFNGRSACVDVIANAYLLKGELPAEGTVCTDD